MEKNQQNLGFKAYRLVQILNSIKVEEEDRKTTRLFEYFDDEKLWVSYELWEQLYTYLNEDQQKKNKIEGQIKEIFKLVKNLVVQEKQKTQSVEDELKKKVNNFEVIADQMKKCKKSLTVNQGTDILSLIGKKNKIPLSIIAQKIDDFQEEHITNELIQFTKGIKSGPMKKNGELMVLCNTLYFLQIKEVIALIPISKEGSKVL